MSRQQSKDARRRAILAAAGKLLSRRRFAEIALADVAAEANVAKGTLYLYFDNKDALYLAYVSQMTAPLLAKLQEKIPIAARVSAFAAVELILRDVLDFARQTPAIQDVIHATTRASQEAQNGKLKRELRLLLVDTLQNGIDRGELRDLPPELSAEVILSVIPRFIQRCAGKPKSTVDAVVAHLTGLFGHGILRQPPPVPRSKKTSPTASVREPS